MDEKNDGSPDANGLHLWHPHVNGTNTLSKMYAERPVNGSRSLDGKPLERDLRQLNGQTVVPNGYVHDHSELNEEMSMHLSKRAQELRARMKTYEKRKELGYQREKFFGILARLGVILRESTVAELRWSGKLLPLIRKLQDSRDRLQELEDEYVLLEDELHRAELEYEQEAQRFVDRFGSAWYGQPNGMPAIQPARDANGSLPLGSSAQNYEDTAEEHPLLNAYYSRLADAGLIRERMVDLLMDYFEGLSDDDNEAEDRQHLAAGQDATPPTFSSLWGESLDELDAVQRDLRDLGRQAQQQGLLASFESSIPSDNGNQYEVEKPPSTVVPQETQDEDPISHLDPSRSIPLSTRQRVNEWFTNNMDPSGLEMRLFRAAIDDVDMELFKAADHEDHSLSGTIFGSEVVYLSSMARRSGLSIVELAASEKRRRRWQRAYFEVTGHRRALSY